MWDDLRYGFDPSVTDTDTGVRGQSCGGVGAPTVYINAPCISVYCMLGL
jgi:hypothetical protein